VESWRRKDCDRDENEKIAIFYRIIRAECVPHAAALQLFIGVSQLIRKNGSAGGKFPSLPLGQLRCRQVAQIDHVLFLNLNIFAHLYLALY
jgi:hypothetical protein